MDIWHKHAASAVATLALLDFTLLALGRLDLALYTSAGALCALYGHGLPYRARARTVGAIVLGTLASTGLALTAAALSRSAVVLVAVTAVLAAVHKLGCDAAKVGPPGNLIITFTSAGCAFIPQRLAAVPGHLGLAAVGGAVAWLVCMAPALLRPYGPERIATGRALEAAARLSAAEPDRRRAAGTALARAVAAARHTLRLSTAPRTVADPLHRLLIRAETPLSAAPGDLVPYRQWARDLRRNRPLPAVVLTAGEHAELTEPAEPAHRRPLAALRAVSPLLPLGLRTAAGCAAAGWASLALGVGRPYWAVVTAASVFQASALLSRRRAWHRALGNLLGLVLFTAFLPVARQGALALVLLVLVCQLGAEALIQRAYWLGSIFVTPMALLMTEFATQHPARGLVADRWLDTCIGVLAGLAACLLITNRRTAHRLDRALAHLHTATREADHGPAAGTARARERLAAALVELRDAADTAVGEWRQPALPHARIAAAEQDGHTVLAQLVARRSQGGAVAGAA